MLKNSLPQCWISTAKMLHDTLSTLKVVGHLHRRCPPICISPSRRFDVVCESLDCSTWKKFSYIFDFAWIRLLLSHVTRKTKWTKGETQIQAFNAAKMPSCWASYSFWWLNQFSHHQETAHFWATASGHSQLSTTMVSSHPFSALPTLHWFFSHFHKVGYPFEVNYCL